MKNRDSNENIYRNMEKCYALLQVHIIFSFHTLLYIKHRKVRKIIGEFQRKSEKIGENRRISGKNRGISEENARKIEEFPRNPFLEVAEPKGDPAVVFGRFCSHFRSFLDMIPNDSRFFPFSFLFVPQPLVFMF